MTEIGMITQQKLKEHIHYCHESGAFTWIKSTSNRAPSGSSAGTIKADPASRTEYLVIKLFGVFYRAHRLAWLYMYGEFPDGDIDHENGVGTDNRILNLRVVTHIVNHKNMPLRSDNNSGVVGVSFDKQRNKWSAEIRDNRKKVFLGRFEDFDAAVQARKAAEVKYGYHSNHGRVM